MPKQDFSDYEKRLSIDHEQRCRTVLSAHFVWKVCKIRKCSRDRTCTGPMLISAHQDRKVRVQREIGLSGHACASLPACIAKAREAAFRDFEDIMEDFQRYRIDHPEVRLPKFDRCLKGRQPRRDTANP
ncbi:hypothetical protein OIU34_37825 [Pararhizobium sp. BT-229]|uniref:hypothetical protein n=1 Tax=Pararhizobium sp. BT-229 TaxID=2986923 RepID=UPI0021F78642|nr:hypothetical protein [Pararhizobium sp. BT-229]MCV9967588.1 hypothetical protein [Pararhizobium sp. BT-229]